MGTEAVRGCLCFEESCRDLCGGGDHRVITSFSQCPLKGKTQPQMKQVKVGSFGEHPPHCGTSWQLKVVWPGLHRLTEPPWETTGVCWPPCVPGFMAPQQQGRTQGHGGNPGPHTPLQGLQHRWCSWCSGMSPQDLWQRSGGPPPQVHHHFKDTPQDPSVLSDPSRTSRSSRTTLGSWLCPGPRLLCLPGPPG